MALRVCPTPNCPELIPRNKSKCDNCQRLDEQHRGTRQQRGYDAAHDRLRAAWQRQLDAGAIIRCATCPTIIDPKSWDLGHTQDRTSYIGPQCRPCNRNTMSR